jgi:SAM-dependent methyltransferase
VALKPIEWSKAYATWGLSTASLERAYSPARLLDVLRTFLPQAPTGPVLELGSAPGRWLAWVEQNLHLPTVGLDLDPEGTRLSRQLFPSLRVIRGNALALPFPDNAFGASFSLGLLEHFDEPLALLREIRRTLTTDGLMVCSVPNIAPGSVSRLHWRLFLSHHFATHRTYTLGDLVRLVREAGFDVLHQEYNGLYIPRGQRLMGHLPGRRLLRHFETTRLATSLVVVARKRAG